MNNDGRAGTIIHEATHQLAKTGDDVNMSGKIIKPSDGSSKPSGATGCKSNSVDVVDNLPYALFL